MDSADLSQIYFLGKICSMTTSIYGISPKYLKIIEISMSFDSILSVEELLTIVFAHTCLIQGANGSRKRVCNRW